MSFLILLHVLSQRGSFCDLPLLRTLLSGDIQIRGCLSQDMDGPWQAAEAVLDQMLLQVLIGRGIGSIAPLLPAKREPPKNLLPIMLEISLVYAVFDRPNLP